MNMELYRRSNGQGPSKYQQVKSARITNGIYRDSDRYAVSKQKLRALETERIGREKYYSLRDQWSWFLRFLLGVMVLFQFLITGAIGLQIVDFFEYKTFLYAILVENFLQIVGMSIIVVKFLFPTDQLREQLGKKGTSKMPMPERESIPVPRQDFDPKNSSGGVPLP